MTRNRALRAIRSNLLSAEKRAEQARSILLAARQNAWATFKELGIDEDDFEAWCRVMFGETVPLRDEAAAFECLPPSELAQDSEQIRTMLIGEEAYERAIVTLDSPDLTITPPDVPHEPTEPEDAPTSDSDDGNLMARAGVYDYYEPDAE